MTDRRCQSASAGDYLHLCRPKQWAKNLLVAAAPFAAGVMDDPATVVTVVVGIVAFSLVSSGIYAINDARDVEADRNHPRKRTRPIAAGRIAPRTAIIFGAVLVAAGLGLGLAASSYGFVAILAAYAGMMAAYSVWLKHVALVDIAVIASGFLLRALSGAVLVDVPISTWFLVVTTFGALFIAAGKRFGERMELTNSGRDHRAALDDYAPGFIEFLLGVSAAVVLLSYSLWALEIQDGVDGIPWAVISLGPFVLGVLRYAQLIYLGRGGEPETLVINDRGLQAIGVAWIITVALAFYGGGT
jgi:decaprenyl-phosphate phosphoribosyltransferase